MNSSDLRQCLHLSRAPGILAFGGRPYSSLWPSFSSLEAICPRAWLCITASGLLCDCRYERTFGRCAISWYMVPASGRWSERDCCESSVLIRSCLRGPDGGQLGKARLTLGKCCCHGTPDWLRGMSGRQVARCTRGEAGREQRPLR
ncbi:hypothetical protein M8818_005511 [Zalaria obscura]|uniref:Uncharacterized protein n=1 Tax=Zalaria obscura TaxID=2024903 RepID=A0ACC3S8S1_9PEZI